MDTRPIQARVRDELRALPRGTFAQNELRMVFAVQRQYDLARDALTPVRASFEAALRSVVQRHSGFIPTIADTATWMS